jgi:hypothetical protein
MTCRTSEQSAAWVAPYEAHYRGVYQPAYAQLRPLHHAAAALAAGDGLKAPRPG